MSDPSAVPAFPSSPLTRRQFTQQAALAAGALAAAPSIVVADSTPAILGGAPVRKGGWPNWPVYDAGEEQAIQTVLKSTHWYRYAGGPSPVDAFEKEWAAALGAAYCQATTSGTTSLITALGALEIGPGDEVLVPPYTFIATVNAVMLHHALPVWVDVDPATAQIDPALVPARVNANTRCVIPVHIGGACCDMDALLAVAREKNLLVLEDSCQTHTGEWKGKRLGTLGDAGCYSFQNSKNITAGEGGAMVTNREEIYRRANAFQNQGTGKFPSDGRITANGGNFRMPPFQGALLQQQLKRLDEQSRRREANADYLSGMLNDIGGVRAKKKAPGLTRHGYHLYIFEFDPDQFAGMNKGTFTKALAAEGVPVSGGYTALNKAAWVDQMLNQRGFQRIYGDKRLKQWRDENVLPANDKMLENTCWLGQNVLLADRAEVHRIGEAVKRIKENAGRIAKA